MARRPDTTRVRGVIAALDQWSRQWSRRARKHGKLPQGNAVVLAVLRSRAHRLLSGSAIELRYTGRRSGRLYVLPVQYAGTGDRLVVRASALAALHVVAQLPHAAAGDRAPGLSTARGHGTSGGLR